MFRASLVAYASAPGSAFRLALGNLVLLLVAGIVCLASPQIVRGQDGTWTRGANSNLWGNTSNWLGGTMAGGADSTATFDQINLLTAGFTVDLNGNRTVGHLVFNDQDNSDGAFWNLTNNILTLQATGTPTITLDGTGSTTANGWHKDARITSILAGAQGFEFSYVNGAAFGARFELYGNNTYTGITDIKSGIIQVGTSLNALGASGTMADRTIVRSGARLHMEGITFAPEIIQLDGGTLSDPVAHSPTLTGLVYLTAPSFVNKGGGGTMTFNPTSGNAIDLGNHTLTFTNSNLSANSALSFQVQGPIVGTGGITKATSSNAIIALNAQNTYEGVTAINGGTLRLGAAETVGTSGPLGKSVAANPGSITFGGGYLQYSAANQHDYSGRFSTAAGQLFRVDLASQNVTWASNISSGGASELWIVGAANPPIPPFPGTLTLTGTNSIGTGGIHVGFNQSPLGALTGSLLISGGATSTTGVLQVGHGANGKGVVRVTGGTLTAASANITSAGSNGSNAVIRQSAGQVSISGTIMAFEGRPLIAVAGGTFGYGTLNLSATSGGMSVFDVSGTGGVSGGQANIGAANARAGRLTVRAGTFTATGMTLGSSGTNSFGNLVTSGGGTVNLGTANLNLGGGSGTTGFGTANLVGGTVKAGGIAKTGTGTTTANLTFSGGTLQAMQNSATFLQGLTGANIYVGGATIDTQNFNITVAQPLLGNPGDGVLTIPITNGGSNYLAPPIITISGGGGTGATAVANLNQAGVVESITVTNPGFNYTSGALSYSIDNTGTQGSGLALDDATLGDNTTGGLTKLGGGMLTLTGASTYTGPTLVNAGTLALSHGSLANNIASSSTIHLAGATSVLNTTNLPGTADLVLADGQTLKGVGTVVGNLTIAAGSTIAPGNSPGIMNQDGDQVWETDGNFNWQILDATGVAGTGFSLLSIDGALTIESGFNFNLWSLSNIGPDVDGDAGNFDETLTQYWTVATATEGLVDPANLDTANVFTLVNNGTGGFTNFLGDGTFSLIQGGGEFGSENDVVLKFTAVTTEVVPEPGTLALAVLGLLGLGFAAWRRRK